MKKLIVLLVIIFSINIANAQWLPLNTGTTNSLSSVYFINNNIGYAVGNNGIILKTINGGTNWVNQYSNNHFVFTSVFMTDTNVVYVSGFTNDVDMLGLIIETTDGGNNWFTIDSNDNCRVNSLYFTNSLTGYGVGVDNTYYLTMRLKTVDAGDSWETLDFTSFSALSNLNSVFFTDNNTGYAVGYDPRFNGRG